MRSSDPASPEGRGRVIEGPRRATMNLDTATRIFGELERHRYEDPGYEDGRDSDQPILNVRLDASTNRQEGDVRSYRVRASMGGGMDEVDHYAWQLVLDQARAHDLSVRVENNGIELS
jgi:hypothetical protein